MKGHSIKPYPLNRVSATNAILAAIEIHGVSIHRTSEYNTYYFTFQLQGHSIAEHLKGLKFKYSGSLITEAYTEVEGYFGANLTLLNKDALVDANHELEDKILSLEYGFIEVLKSLADQVIKKGQSFISNYKFIDIALNKDTDLEEVSALKHAENVGYKSLMPFCIRTYENNEYYFVGDILYSDQIEVPNTFELESYGITTVENKHSPKNGFIFEKAKDILIKTVFSSVQTKLHQQGLAFGLFVNSKSGAFSQGWENFEQFQDSFTGLSELWFEREKLYNSFVKNVCLNDSKVVDALPLTDNDLLAVKTLIQLVKFDGKGHKETDSHIYWELLLDMCNYKLMIPKTQEFSALKFYRGNTCILSGSELSELGSFKLFVEDAWSVDDADVDISCGGGLVS